MTAPSSRSMVSVPQINVAHDIVIEGFLSKFTPIEEEKPFIEGLRIVEEGDIKIKIDSTMKDEGIWTKKESVHELVLGWGISHEDIGSEGIGFGLCNLCHNKRQLPITATFYILKNGKKVKTLDTLRKVLEPTERWWNVEEVEDDQEEEEDPYSWVELFSADEFEDDYDKEDGGKMKEFLDKKGCLTIRLEISILPCLSIAGKRPHKPETEEDQDNVEKRIRTDAVNSLAEDMSSLRHGCQIFRIVCVWPFGLLDYGPARLRCKI